MYSNSIYLFRRDHRIQYNATLEECLRETTECVYPLFVFTPEQVTVKNKYKSNNAIQFMMESILDLEKQIQQQGGSNSQLNICYGNLLTVLRSICKTYQIDAVYMTEDYTPYARKIQSEIEQLGTRCGFDLCLIEDYNLLSPRVLDIKGRGYLKFTPYYKKHLTIKIDIPSKKSGNYSLLQKFDSATKYTVTLRDMFMKLLKKTNPDINVHGGRKNGLKQLLRIKNQRDYGKTRNDLETQTTHMSAYLKFGCVGAKEMYAFVDKLFGKHHDLIRQLVWRDFYSQILFFNPRVIEKSESLKPKYDNIKWKNNKRHFLAWTKGETGFPVVDAGMRQLNETGFMHNRARLITASFLIKNLQVDWRLGERYFAQKLVDYDPASNNGNWQWVSGGGADSSPYFRIFNPWTQQQKFDPDAKYIRKWIPQLKNISTKDIHNWTETYVKYTGYPGPIIDYKQSREDALEMYKTGLYG